MVELMDNSLDVFFEPSRILSLVGAITISMLRETHRFKCIELIVVEEKCIFAKSLMGATMQDGSRRERSVFCVILNSNSKF